MPPVVPPDGERRSQPAAKSAPAPRSGIAAGRKGASVDRRRRPAKRAGAPAGQRDTAVQYDLAVGQDIEVTIEDVAQGGWCIAKPEGLPVLFVRHALPGERVVARVTELTSKFARADAITVLERSADRVEAPCPHARPGGCGGCDWQHASLGAQRALKASVIEQQLRRLGPPGLDQPVTVEPLPDRAAPGLGWRTRVQFAVDRTGTAGLRAHRSHRVVDIGDCLIAHDAVRALDIPGHDWSGPDWEGTVAVEVAVGGVDTPDNLAVTVVSDQRGDDSRSRRERPDRQRGGKRRGPRHTLIDGRPFLAEGAAGRLWQVSADGFWQVHPAAADVLSEAVVAALEPKPGDTVLDLYCGAGLFAGVVAPLVGPDGGVTGIESDPAAVRNARQNTHDYPWAEFRAGDVAELAPAGDLPPARLVIADPPRAGLAREVVDWLTENNGATRFCYVSCDPATLARDLALLIAGGWRLDGLRAFDVFPMTHHVECVALLTRPVPSGEPVEVGK